ncbi:MAG: rod shape-determining protein MreC [Gammaproteobacteria bacterium]|nr:rod shape-determining protein MreC [Gammaproteobacteria bacterium]MDE2345645.1 rod shape-determining protein MreC [Gammaproteobacteria bacterium]
MFALHHRQRSPRLFTRNPAGTVRTLLLIAACITLMFYDHQRGHLQKVHAALSTLVYPVQAAVNAPYALASWAENALAVHIALVRENSRLKKQLLMDAAELQQTAALQQENARLRELMHSGATLSGHVVLADMLAVDTDPFRHLILIDKGTDNGVFDGQTLLDAHGIVGQVIQVGPVSAQVALITDPSQAIQVQINRTNQRTLAVGGADVNELSLPYLTNNADVKPGDLLVTSGLGGRYPAGYPVAVVTQVHRDPAEPFASISAHAVADLDHGHEVLLYFPAIPEPPAPNPGRHNKPKAAGKKTK